MGKKNDYLELVEVLDNPRRAANEVAIKIPGKGKMSFSKFAEAYGYTKEGGSKKKKRKGRRTKTLDKNMVAAGVVAANMLEMMVLRRGDVTARIPDQIEPYTGAIMAAVGWFGSKRRGQKRKAKSFFYGLFLGGIGIQTFYELFKRTDAATKAAVAKIWGENLQTVEGLGAWPPGPHMTQAQAATALGMQNQIPWNPYGLGELMYGSAPTDPALNPALMPAGLGTLDMDYQGDFGRSGGGLSAFHDSMEGQFAGADGWPEY